LFRGWAKTPAFAHPRKYGGLGLRAIIFALSPAKGFSSPGQLRMGVLMFDDNAMEIARLAGSGYTCAQIVVLMGLRVMGRENPDLVRAMSPLAMGASHGSLCGALTGGLCLMGTHLGKGDDFETPVLGSKIPAMALVKWFTQDELKGATAPTCAAIFESGGQRLDLESSRPTAACADLVSRCFSKALALLAEHGINPSQGRDLP
jgi:hypothetical protein